MPFSWLRNIPVYGRPHLPSVEGHFCCFLTCLFHKGVPRVARRRGRSTRGTDPTLGKQIPSIPKQSLVSSPLGGLWISVVAKAVLTHFNNLPIWICSQCNLTLVKHQKGKKERTLFVWAHPRCSRSHPSLSELSPAQYDQHWAWMNRPTQPAVKTHAGNPVWTWRSVFRESKRLLQRFTLL